MKDGSDSIDRIVRRFGLGPHRALFQTGPGHSLQQRRKSLASRRGGAGRSDTLRPSARVGRRIPDLANIYRIRVPNGVSSRAALAALVDDPHVAYAQPNYSIELDQASPVDFDDPFLVSSGAWGQPHLDLWGLDRIGAAAAWSISQGEGVVVAVVDTGLDSDHPDIADNVWVNPGEDLDGDGRAEPEDRNGLDDDGNGFIDDLTGFDFANSLDLDEDGFYDGPGDFSDADPFDDNGHGTHVSGTIAAVGNNGIGIVGVAPRARIMALKGFPSEGAGLESVLWRAVLYAAEMGASVINTSWSCARRCPENPLAEDVLEMVEALGTVVVTSAGNSSEDVLFRSPENTTSVITVGALGVDDRLPDFSNRGWLIDVVAPGGGPNTPTSIFVARRNILSLLSSGTLPTQLPFAVGDSYLRFSGTSMAAPHVAGAVALLRSVRPDLTPADVRRLIRISARDLGSPGHDPEFGSGALDLVGLLTTSLPDLEFELEAPRVGALHDPESGDLVLRGRASGNDLVSLAVFVGAGLRARTFVPLSHWGASWVRPADQRSDDDVLARWDVSDLPDGPYVLRVEAGLSDGRLVEEHLIVGIERNAPIRLSDTESDATRPDVSGRRVVWQVRESAESALAHDLQLGRFPGPKRTASAVGSGPIDLIREEGDQRSPRLAGREVAWATGEATRIRLGHCRIDRRAKGCRPQRVSDAPGSFFSHWLEKNWLVWTRSDENEIVVEGCPVGRSARDCDGRPLVQSDVGTPWIPLSFDGHSLILRRGSSQFARCPISRRKIPCQPESIQFAGNFRTPVEIVHEGRLLALKRVGLGFIFPPGCGEDDFLLPECAPEFGPFTQLYSCWLDETELACEPRPITPRAALDSLIDFGVSGRRIVWPIGSRDEETAVHFCEFFPATGECVDQRLGGSPAFQARPSIDAHRIVWEDARSGRVGISGIELPRLLSPRRLTIAAGGRLAIPLRGLPGSSGALRFEVEPIDGVTPEQARVRIVTIGRRADRAVLRGRMPLSESVDTRWRLRAVGSGGLFTENLLEIFIRPMRHGRTPRWPNGRVGSNPIRIGPDRLDGLIRSLVDLSMHGRGSLYPVGPVGEEARRRIARTPAASSAITIGRRWMVTDSHGKIVERVPSSFKGSNFHGSSHLATFE